MFSDKVNLQQAAVDNIDWAVRRRADLIVVNVGLWWPCAPVQIKGLDLGQSWFQAIALSSGQAAACHSRPQPKLLPSMHAETRAAALAQGDHTSLRSVHVTHTVCTETLKTPLIRQVSIWDGFHASHCWLLDVPRRCHDLCHRWHCELMAKEEFGPAGPKSEGVGTDGHAVARRIVKAGAEVGSRSTL